MRHLFFVAPIIFMFGCAASPDDIPMPNSEIKPITYDYQIPGVNKKILFARARDYMATAYGDSRSVIRVQDENEAVIIGKGAVTWRMLPNNSLSGSCSTEYNIRFIAKDEKARLQVELIYGAPVYSSCINWKAPSPAAYRYDVLPSFDPLSKDLGSALKGLGAGNSFKDF